MRKFYIVIKATQGFRTVLTDKTGARYYISELMSQSDAEDLKTLLSDETD